MLGKMVFKNYVLIIFITPHHFHQTHTHSLEKNEHNDKQFFCTRKLNLAWKCPHWRPDSVPYKLCECNQVT